MSGDRSERDLERLLDADRGEFGPLYDRLSRAEPPRRLDRAVIAEATRAAHGPRSHGSQRWMLGIGSVAGVVLAAGIAWQVGREFESRDAVPVTAPVGRSAPQVVPVQPISPSAPSMAEESPAEAGTIGENEAKDFVVTGSRVRPEQAAKPTRAAPRAAVPPPPPPAAAKAEAEAFPQAPAEPMPLLEQRVLEQPALEQSSTEHDTGSERLRKSRAERADAVEDRSDPSSAAGNSAAQAPIESAPRSISAPAPSTSTRLRRNMQLEPQAWLAEIAQLRDQGRTQEVMENIRLFRRMHPDWPLSDELRRLAQ